MKKIINRGFTLIELLVVIAIIGILASIVLVSLNSARSKGKDTRVISDVRQVRVQIDAEQSIGGTFYTGGTNCIASIGASGAATISGSGNCGSLNSDASANGGSLQIQTAASSGATSYGSYAVYGPISTGYFCMDSTGSTTQKSGSIPAAAGVATCR